MGRLLRAGIAPVMGGAKLFSTGRAPEPEPVTGTANIVDTSPNLVIGTSQPASNIAPSQIGGLDISYFGSFGQNFWNLRMGDGTQKIPGVDEMQVQLGGSPIDTIQWSELQMRYQATASADLWATIGVSGEPVNWQIK